MQQIRIPLVFKDPFPRLWVWQLPTCSVLNRNIIVEKSSTYIFVLLFQWKRAAWPGQDYFQTYILSVVQFPWYNLRMCGGTILPLFPPSYLILGGGLGLWRHVGPPISFLPSWHPPAADEPSHAGEKLERKWSAKKLKESDRHRSWQKTDKTLNLRLCLCFYLWPEKGSKKVISISICKNLQTSHLICLYPYLMLTVCWRRWWKTTL